MDWRIKASIQKMLSATRLGDRLNHLLVTLNKDYHKHVFIYQSHEAVRKFKHAQLNQNNNWTALEIGIGYSAISAITLALLGFQKIITVDISPDLQFKSLQKQLSYFDEDYFNTIVDASTLTENSIRKKMESLKKAASLKEVLDQLNIIYIAPYQFDSIEKTATSFDYICSQVVLEHIPPLILNTLFLKSKKWLASGGYAVHTINFIDHFANPGLFQDKSISEFNFLKYSNEYWNFWAGNPIAYTNRLSYIYYLDLCKTHQLNVVDFIGENYRERVEMNPNSIHEDVINKYGTLTEISDLMKYQRGTLIIKA